MKLLELELEKKIHETLCPLELSDVTYENDNSYVILEGDYKYKKKLKLKKVIKNFNWNSGNNKNFLNEKEIRKLLKNNA